LGVNDGLSAIVVIKSDSISIMGNQEPIYYKLIRNIASNGAEYENEIQKWLNESDENKTVYRDMLNVWLITGSFPERFSPDKSKGWKKVKQHIYLQKKKHFLYRRFTQVAAAIVIVFMSIWTGTKLNNLDQRPQYTEVFSLAGQKTRVLLPDSSVVLLNGNSQVRFDRNFNGHRRIVELIGEGFFEVHKDLSRQFIVTTSELDIKVFGTSFNVKAYADDQQVEVGLKNGSISIDRNNKEIVKLIPGQLATFNKKQLKLNLEKKDIEVVSAWTRDELVFDETTLGEIVKYLERWYGVNIQADSVLLDGELLTFKVKTESLSELLELINLLKPIKYHIDGKQVIIAKP
jgi:ferric-dicitrate binding protein FerR (iron transport regulator)